MDLNFNDEMGLGDDEGLDGEAAEIPILGPLRDVPTRWNSTLKMLQRALLLRKGLDATCSNREWRYSEITEEEWKLIEEAVELLKPFETATRLVEGFKHPTLSLVLPLFNKLLSQLDSCQKDVNRSEEARIGASAAREKLKKYYKRLTDVYLVATVLDCRLKLAYFKDRLKWEQGDGDQSGQAEADQEVDMVEKYVLPA